MTSQAALSVENDRWFRLLAETSTAAIFVFTAERMVYVNEAWARLTGYTTSELLGIMPWQLAPPADRETHRRQVQARLRGEPVPERFEVRIATKHGAEKWIEVSAARLAVDGEPPAVIVTAIDVTPLKKAASDLREGVTRLELAHRVAGVVPWEWDLLTDAMIISDNALEILGCTAEELWTTGTDLLRAIAPADQAAFAQALRACVQGERDLALEMRMLCPDGKLRWASVRGRTLPDADGVPRRVIGVTHDISARKASEERLRTIVAGTSATTGTDFLRSLVHYLAITLNARVAMVCELLGTRADRVRVLALWSGNDYGEPFEHELAGTPCEGLRGQDAVFHAAGVWRLFPDARWLQEQRIEGLCAVALDDAEGARLGYLCVMDTEPLVDDATTTSVLKVFAARAGAEIERKRAEEALAREKDRAQVTLASIGDGVIRTDAEGIIDYLNPVAERLTGWMSAAACGKGVAEVFRVVDEATGKPRPDAVARCLAEGRVVDPDGYSTLIRRYGGEFAIRETVAPIRDRNGRIAGSVLVFKDLTQLRGMEREMIFLAQHDPLTGLLNRREFERRLDRCLDSARLEGRQHALLYLDLDEFKVVNDTCGHLAGDEMLKQVTALLRSFMRKSDTLARLGGDEFGVLLEDIDLAHAREFGERMRTAVRHYRFAWQERYFEIGVSIGLVPITEESGDIAQILSNADAACYVAKEGGRNRMHEYQADDRALAERYGEMQWISRIHMAFAEQRFCLFRQGIHPLHSREPLDGDLEEPFCEIFIRLIDEEGVIVAPGAFIPAAERYHLIASIDRWVVHAAFVAMACSALTHGDRTRFTLNLSGQSIGDPGFLEHVLQELEDTGIAPARVFFEITETAAVSNLAQAVSFIRVLKEKGFRFILDDFGSGLSSFAYLKNLQVDFLKIDGSFVRNMSESSVQRALVEAIHQIGRVMGIRTIAEAVEDQETLAVLREIGVDYAQGYVLDMPEALG
jgi:diguanylate cyclase (GGDEF)-like protein/PAS domain S-box-containing protein